MRNFGAGRGKDRAAGEALTAKFSLPAARAGIGCLLLAGAIVSGCSSQTRTASEASLGVRSSPRTYSEGQSIPKGGGVYKVGSPYQVSGRWYEPRHEPGYDRVGVASWYGSDFHGRRTANGEVFDMNALTAAHPTLPLPSYAYVTNLNNGRTILVRINDRGPYVDNRLIDLSRASATALGYAHGGLGRVRVRYAGAAPLDGNDIRERQYIASQPWANDRQLALGAPLREPQRVAPARQDAWSALSYRSGLGAF